MSIRAKNTPRVHAPSSRMNGRTAQDISGCTIFSEGEVGDAHVVAHQMLDSGRIELGHQLLGERLDACHSFDSKWIHLQFHMALFELALGDWEGAHTRFMERILQTAATTENALTDAPALLWQLKLTAPEPVQLPWQPLRRTALRRMQRPSDPHVELHNLFALAGAGDLASIRRWLLSRPAATHAQAGRLVERLAMALQAYITCDYRRAASILRRIVPQLSQIGGSRAQNQLFRQLERNCWLQVSDVTLEPLFTNAA